MSSRSQKPSRIYPCDQCLHRKVRCDKTLPRCNRCFDTHLQCTRDVVRQRPGRKKGSGAVISRLRTDPERSPTDDRESHVPTQAQARDYGTPQSPETGLPKSLSVDELSLSGFEEYFSVPSRLPRRVSTPYGSPTNSVTQSERLATIMSSLPNLSQDIDQFFDNLYPIWPIIDEAALRDALNHPEKLDRHQTCLVLSICALSALHIPESNSPPEEPRQRRAQRYIEQCMQLRSTFEYIESASIVTIQTSLFLSVAEVEFQRIRSSWFLLREAIMLAQELGFCESTLSTKLGPAETLAIKRTLYLLSLTERGLTLLRDKPFAIMIFDYAPEERFENEDPRILIGLQSLSRLFNILDKQILDFWVNGSAGQPVAEGRIRKILAAQHTLASIIFDVDNLTDIQKADILITQQWLKLVLWQLSMRQGLLSSAAQDPSLSYHFPCLIAKSLCELLPTISTAAMFIHGIAIFERTFEITYSFIDSLCLSRTLSSSLEELRVLFRVLRESPNSPNTYIKILETKLVEQAGEDGNGLVPLVY